MGTATCRALKPPPQHKLRVQSRASTLTTSSMPHSRRITSFPDSTVSLLQHEMWRHSLVARRTSVTAANLNTCSGVLLAQTTSQLPTKDGPSLIQSGCTRPHKCLALCGKEAVSHSARFFSS